MADDLQNYKLQLQQVEAAQDLEEVIGLTRDLIKQQLGEQNKSAYAEPSTSRSYESGTAGSRNSERKPPPDASVDNYDEVEAALLAFLNGLTSQRTAEGSPDKVNGRVGIGTCGVSGKAMTKYSYGV